MSQWMLTCKELTAQLEPHFWRHPVITKAYQDPKALTRYRHHFRSIRVDMEDMRLLDAMMKGYTASSPHIGFPNLRKLLPLSRNRMFYDKSTAELQLGLLCQSPSLTHLTITGRVFRQDPLVWPRFLMAVTRLPLLRQFIVEDCIMDVAVGFDLMKLCFTLPQLIDLELDVVLGRFPYPVIDKANETIDPSFGVLLKYLQDLTGNEGEPIGLGLRSLRLPDIKRGYPMAFLFPFLRSMVPNIERLVLPKVYESIDEDQEEQIKEIIATEFDDSYLGWGDDGVFETLLQYHAATLEEIDLPRCSMIYSDKIQLALKTCRNLKTFRVNPAYEGFISIHFQDAVSQEWVCRDITILQLCLSRYVFRPEGMCMEKAITRTAQRVYAQIGQLTKLEELSLSCEMGAFWSAPEEDFSKDLTLEHGWLAELTGLKRLRHFQMETDFWSSMGQLEVEFMDGNWPKLESIGIACGDLEEEVLSLPHWQWLKEKRPYLSYTKVG
ncbi:hypothetical protein BGX31_003286 [Mortierella sp. GBA43]|nr:hypothetical protein BGX31_003286 [Mortierella sp. GBA43]